MAEETLDKHYADRVKEVVKSFVQVWVKFGALLPGELSSVEDRSDGLYPEGGTHPETNYEFFFRVSSCISWGNNPNMGELSSALSVPLSTATRIADWMVDKNYAERLADPEDRRVVKVALTDKGRELHGAIENYIGQRVGKVLASLTDEEQTILFTLVRKVVASLKDVIN